MNQKSVIELTTKLTLTLRRDFLEEVLEEIINLFNNYLKQNPQDTEVWLRYSSLLFWGPHDDEEAIRCIQEVLQYDSNNVLAIMILVYIENYSHWNYDEKLFEKLCLLQSQDNEIKSLIEYEKSWYYYDKNEELYLQSLINSITLCDKFVWNYKSLAYYYCYKKEMYKEALYYLNQAIKNVQHVYRNDRSSDPLAPGGTIDSGVKGTHISYMLYDSMVELRDRLTEL